LIGLDAVGTGPLLAPSRVPDVIARLLPSTAVAIAISHSGASHEPVECLALARGRRATTVAVTARHPSPLTSHADIVLLTSSTEARYREETMASHRAAQLARFAARGRRHSTTGSFARCAARNERSARLALRAAGSSMTAEIDL
jgi:fructoselysine-6-P-deglycase FrlB-like protein